MINKDIYNKVIELCFPKITNAVKEATYRALNGENVKALVGEYKISKNVIYDNMHKFNRKYALVQELIQLEEDPISFATVW